MAINELKEFISFCQIIQPQTQENIKRFFEGVILFPYDKELLLQAYLYLNIKNIFPSCIQLLLFEKAPNGENTEQGKCDFVYLTREGTLFLIETKYINTAAKTQTEKTRKKRHRKEVVDQVLGLKTKFSEYHQIPSQKFKCGVFTTDTYLSERGKKLNILTEFISINDLNEWQRKQEIGQASSLE